MPISTAEFMEMEARVNSARRRPQQKDSNAPEVESESKLHAQIIAHCRAKSWIYFHGSMAHKTKRTLGEMDFTLLLPEGRVLFIECKGKHTKISPEQLAMAAWMKRLGHRLWFVRSMDEFLKIVG